ncbi:hypothetical protein WJX81_001874 [Elliptochloris bilobata]|uniref:Protein kinase domain-containing protein n=1 Tax=Elliptochloris bilobata TaxID=381761 RepID=A0AAW1S1K1_9CHLO
MGKDFGFRVRRGSLAAAGPHEAGRRHKCVRQTLAPHAAGKAREAIAPRFGRACQDCRVVTQTATPRAQLARQASPRKRGLDRCRIRAAARLPLQTLRGLGVARLQAAPGGLAAALVEQTLRAMPCRPDAVSHIQGPFLEVSKVDARSVDVRVISQFRAHFDRLGPLERASLHIEPIGSPLAHAVAAADATRPAPATLADVGRTPLRQAARMTLLSPAASGAAGADLQRWEVDPKRVILGERLAVGGFAEVFVGKYEGTVVAVKVLLSDDAAMRRLMEREAGVLALLRHPNLLLFIGFCGAPRPAILSEFMHRGSLFDVLRKAGRSDARLARSVAVSVARGMAYLHSRQPPILHKDLKSPNILVDNNWRVKVADFGLAQMRSNVLPSTGAGFGTPEWMAPEVLRCQACDERSDVYSYGVVLWELLTGDVPWVKLHPMQVVGAVAFQGARLSLPERGDACLLELCGQCMESDPAQRPTFPAMVARLEAEFGSDVPFDGDVCASSGTRTARARALAQSGFWSSASTPAAAQQRGPSLYPMRSYASLGKPPLSPARSAGAAPPV